VAEYVSYYHETVPTWSRKERASRSANSDSSWGENTIQSLPRIGGPHQRYTVQPKLYRLASMDETFADHRPENNDYGHFLSDNDL